MLFLENHPGHSLAGSLGMESCVREELRFSRRLCLIGHPSASRLKDHGARHRSSSRCPELSCSYNRMGFTSHHESDLECKEETDTAHLPQRIFLDRSVKDGPGNPTMDPAQGHAQGQQSGRQAKRPRIRRPGPRRTTLSYPRKSTSSSTRRLLRSRSGRIRTRG